MHGRWGITFAELATYRDEENHLCQQSSLAMIPIGEPDAQLPSKRNSLISFILQGKLPGSRVAADSERA